MAEGFKNKVVAMLIEEISLLSGGEFERFGYHVMSIVHPANWVERGTTVNGSPRGYTVDTSAQGSSLVAEMSSDADYFSGEMIKPKHDVDHVFQKHADAVRVWLLCSREASASEGTKIANLESSLKVEYGNKYQSLVEINILDARQTAKHIFDNLENETFVRNTRVYLPSLGRLADENAFSHRIPNVPNYEARIELEAQIVDQLAESTQVTIFGLSGIGKTAIAAKVATKMQPEFDITIWLDASNLNASTDLSDVDVRRSGVCHNLRNLLMQRKCLLVIDDLRTSSAPTIRMNLGESRVIVTTQTKGTADAIELGELPAEGSRRLLQAEVQTPCPEKLVDLVLEQVGGFPLLLCALSKVAQEDGWEAVERCCAEVVEAIEDDQHVKICKRILKCHADSLSHELQFVKWCGSPHFSPELLKVCVTSRAEHNLRKRAFLSVTSSGLSRVHDIVFKAINTEVEVSERLRAEFCDKLDCYIVKEGFNEGLAIRRIIGLHGDLLNRLLKHNPRPAFRYAVALGRSGDANLVDLGDPVQLAHELTERNRTSIEEMEVRAIIEIVEARFTINYARLGREQARETLLQDINALELLRDIKSIEKELIADIRHHRAKMLQRIGKFDESESEFKEILKDYPENAASRLQLARILAEKSNKSDLVVQCRKVIEQFEKDSATVSMPVLLEVLALVAKVSPPETFNPYRKMVMAALKKAREVDSALAVRLVASVSAKAWYTDPEWALRVFEAVEWPCVVLSSDSDRFDWAQAHKDAAKANGEDSPRWCELLKSALAAYETIKNPSHYHFTHYAEALILMKEFERAEVKLLQVQNDRRNSYWYYRMAQALRGQEKYAEALNAIDSALTDQSLEQSKYRPSRLECRYEIKQALGDVTACDDLRDAVCSLPDGDKYRVQLERKLVGNCG